MKAPVEATDDGRDLPPDAMPLLGDEGPLKDYKGGNDGPRFMRNDHRKTNKNHFISWEQAYAWGIEAPMENWSKGRTKFQRNDRASDKCFKWIHSAYCAYLQLGIFDR